MYAVYNKKGERMYQYGASEDYLEMFSKSLWAKDVYPEAGMHVEQVKVNR
jgi:hypothetical protein